MECRGSGLWLAASHRSAHASPDQGKSWTPIPAPAPGVEWYGITGLDAALLAATSHGLFRSQDQGRSWQRAEGELGQSTVTSVLAHPVRAGLAFAAQYDKVFLSIDQGRRWQPLAAAGLERAAIRSLAVLADQPGRLFALVAGRGVFATDLE
jgi:photosystem II stability/assembly factor-like uncharacterized protein